MVRRPHSAAEDPRHARKTCASACVCVCVLTGDARERGELVRGLHGLRLCQGGQQRGLSCVAIEGEEPTEKWGKSQRKRMREQAHSTDAPAPESTVELSQLTDGGETDESHACISGFQHLCIDAAARRRKRNKGEQQP